MTLKKIPKEELELLSYTKIAELYLNESKKPMTTADLFKEVCNLLDLKEKDYQNLITDFFQSLTTSKEFILLENGTWDLKDKHIVKIQLEEDDEEEKKDNNDNQEDSEEETDNFDNIESDDYVEDNDDLGDLTIINEDELED